MSILQRIWLFLSTVWRNLTGQVVVPEPIEPEPPLEPPVEPDPPIDEPEDPVGPQEPPGPAPEPFAHTLWPDEWSVSGAWAIHDGYVQALEVGDGDIVDSTTVVLPTGVFTVTARVFAAEPSGDAFYLVIDGFATRCFPSAWGEWTTVDLPLGVTEAGPHRVGISTAEPGLLVDAIAVTSSDWTGSLDELLGEPPSIEEPEPEEPDEPEQPEPEPPRGDLSDATHSVAPLVDESFDPAKPTLRGGKPLTDTQRYYYDAFTRALLRSDPSPDTSIAGSFGKNDSYHIGRHGEPVQVSALLAMSRSGDGRVLDYLVRGWRAAYADLTVEWDASNLDDAYIKEWGGAKIVNGKWQIDGAVPWSPYKKWLYGGNSGRAGAGTDTNNLQNVKPWAILTQYLWALEVNRGKASPAGFDYGAEADKWREVLRGFIETYTSDTGAAWEKNYAGLDGGLYWGKYRSRAKPGQWPFFARGEGHAIYNSALLCFYCGLLGAKGWDIPNWQDAMTGADLLFGYIRENMVDTVDSRGKPSIVLRGGGAWAAMKATYTAYAALELAHMRDIGRWRDTFDDDTLLRISRSYADMIRPDGSTLKNLASEVDRTGHGLDVSLGSDRTPYQNAINGFSAPLLWSREDDRLFDSATAAQETWNAGGYGSGAKTPILPAVQFVAMVDS